MSLKSEINGTKIQLENLKKAKKDIVTTLERINGAPITDSELLNIAQYIEMILPYKEIATIDTSSLWDIGAGADSKYSIKYADIGFTPTRAFITFEGTQNGYESLFTVDSDEGIKYKGNLLHIYDFVTMNNVETRFHIKTGCGLRIKRCILIRK